LQPVKCCAAGQLSWPRMLLLLLLLLPGPGEVSGPGANWDTTRMMIHQHVYSTSPARESADSSTPCVDTGVCCGLKRPQSAGCCRSVANISRCHTAHRHRHRLTHAIMLAHPPTHQHQQDTSLHTDAHTHAHPPSHPQLPRAPARTSHFCSVHDRHPQHTAGCTPRPTDTPRKAHGCVTHLLHAGEPSTHTALQHPSDAATPHNRQMRPDKRIKDSTLGDSALRRQPQEAASTAKSTMRAHPVPMLPTPVHTHDPHTKPHIRSKQ
jgi:hypothetical protein